MDLQNLRLELDKIDKELAVLFEKRMEVIEKVRVFKIQNNLPFLDSNREKSMKNKNDEHIKNKELLNYYNEFLTACTTISKQYMKDKSNLN